MPDLHRRTSTYRAYSTYREYVLIRGSWGSPPPWADLDPNQRTDFVRSARTTYRSASVGEGQLFLLPDD